MATNPHPVTPKWQRSKTSRRFLVIEHPEGAAEEVGYVRVLTLTSRNPGEEPDVRSAIEWQDPELGPKTLEIEERHYEDGRLSESLKWTRPDGLTEIWHFDEAAQEKLREIYRSLA